MASTVLVTGGLGFIGAHVVQVLLSSGHRVLVIDREVDRNAADDVLRPAERAAAPLLARAIPRPRTLARLLRDQGVDSIVHLASPLATATETDPSQAVTAMLDPFLAILEGARSAGIHKVVWASSVGVFGRPEEYPTLPIPNDAPHRPLTIYGAAKSMMERLSERFTESHGLDTIGLRFPLVYGPARRRGGGQFTTRLIEGAALGESCDVPDGGSRYDWMFVTDAARSVELALGAKPTEDRALTVGGEVASVRDVVDLLRGWFPKARFDVGPGTTDLVADYDTASATEQIGYRPSISLQAGVLATANAARRRAGLEEVA